MPCDASTSDRHRKEIEQALARAAVQAEKLARETRTPLVLWEDGHIVERRPPNGSVTPAATSPPQQATDQP